MTTGPSATPGTTGVPDRTPTAPAVPPEKEVSGDCVGVVKVMDRNVTPVTP